MVIRRGDISWADLPEPIGSGPGGRRPVLVVQANDFNSSAIATVIIAPLTSNLRLARAPGNILVLPHDSGLKKESVINISQLMTADKSLLTERSGRLNAELMEQVTDGLKMVLGI